MVYFFQTGKKKPPRPYQRSAKVSKNINCSHPPLDRGLIKLGVIVSNFGVDNASGGSPPHLFFEGVSESSFVVAPCKAFTVRIVFLTLLCHLGNDPVVFLITGSVNRLP